ncbi:ATP-binding protein [Rhizobium ruizarguesonis]|uniref:sensor histidine kinase n=1 Tax=Rhizobium ruizarguesonis TaxID=2081791 RepID=UPI00102FB9B0|nr:ATP-binding protein [Rhizobium ruizarguesonis]TBC71286.1 hypothetical protein ELH28_33205 [Rhizobium ruizarguesonis]
MTFRVAARTVLELGAELISSDAIAIYELVKNAFDARSPSVLVSVQVVLKRSSLDKLLDGLDDGVFKDCATAFKETKKALETEEDDDNAQAFLSRLDDVSDLRTFRAELQYAYSRYNYIRIVDTGLGMSLPKLREAFLTIGTANRVLERKRGGAADKPILGEKGVGRLAAMRLGSRLYVKTSRPGDTHWSQLSIDWDDFSRDPSQLIDDVPVKARKGFRKAVISDHGTTLTIRNLSADWTLKSLREMAAADFSRLVDPFAVDAFPIAIAFNQTTVETRKIGSLLFKNAHGYCKGQYKVRAPGAGASPVAGADPNDRARLLVDFDYRLYSEKQHFDLGFSELRDAIGQEVPEGTLSSLGAFSFEFYWYNRRILTAIDGIGKQADVRKLVNAWSGGLMVYRDGFRVNPYGGDGDDWLNLNTQAFKSSGYLLNTDQIIGRVNISLDQNPKLLDQTNREGLRDTYEKAALVSILHKFLTGPLKFWMDDINEAYQGLKQVDLDQVEENVQKYDRRVTLNLKQLRELFPEQRDTVDQIASSFSEMKVAFTKAHGAAKKSEKDRLRLIELAGVGLMVEVVAHELARATKHTLQVLKSAKKFHVPTEISSVLDTLGSQLTTIERRLRVLDPLSVSGRQRKAEFDLVATVATSFESRQDELAALGIQYVVRRKEGGTAPVYLKGVKGMFVQIVENLIANSLHWLAVEKTSNSRLSPSITVELSPEHGGSFEYTDNGPGISPQAAERIFDAFYTTRKDEGRGLGLYISKQNANAMGGDLTLMTERRIHPQRLNTFKFVAEK